VSGCAHCGGSVAHRRRDAVYCGAWYRRITCFGDSEPVSPEIKGPFVLPAVASRACSLKPALPQQPARDWHDPVGAAGHARQLEPQQVLSQRRAHHPHVAARVTQTPAHGLVATGRPGTRITGLAGRSWGPRRSNDHPVEATQTAAGIRARTVRRNAAQRMIRSRPVATLVSSHITTSFWGSRDPHTCPTAVPSRTLSKARSPHGVSCCRGAVVFSGRVRARCGPRVPHVVRSDQRGSCFHR